MNNNNMKIILVEDDEGHATLIERNLRRAGISNEIIRFINGREALNFFFGSKKEAAKYEQLLVLLDLNLPEVDGYEVLSQIKGNKKTQHTPIIVLTTTDNPKEIDKCYELGCNVYITKPVEYDSFSDAIRKLGLMLAVVKVPGEL